MEMVKSGRKAALRLSGILALAAGVVAFAAPAHATCCLADLQNGWDPNTGNPIGYELDFAGDATGVIPAQVAEDTLVNPFYAMHVFNGASYNQITVNYDGVANLTRVVLSGDALPTLPPVGFPGPVYVVNGVRTYHTGMNQGWNYAAPPTLVSRHWIYDHDTLELAALGISWDGVFKKRGNPLQWAVIYAETKKRGTGAWHLVAYQAGKKGRPIKFKISNNGTLPAALGIMGYQLGLSGPSDPNCLKTPKCDGNQSALDKLNDEFFPVPGEDGSTFIPVKTRKTLEPGESFVLRAK